MWTTIFVILFIFSLIFNLVRVFTPPKDVDLKGYLRGKKVQECLMWIGVGFLAIIALIIFGYICYFLGGFLVFEDTTFWEKVFYGLFSIFCGLLFVTGVIAMFKSL
jgi:hypothetical protein